MPTNRHLPAHLRLDDGQFLTFGHRPLVQRATCARSPAMAIRKNAATVDSARFQRRLHLSVVVFFLVPDQPRLQLASWRYSRQVLLGIARAQLPILRRHLADGVEKLILVGFVGKKRPMSATGHVGDAFADAETIRGAELTAVMGLHPGQIDGKDVLRIIRVGEFEPLPSEIRGYLPASTNRLAGRRACRKTKENRRRLSVIHT